MRFAEAFIGGRHGKAIAAASELQPADTRVFRPDEDSSEWSLRFGSLVVSRLALEWSFIIAALLLLLAGGYLTFENLRLRGQMAQTRAERAALEERERELQGQLAEQRKSNAETEGELGRVRDRLAPLEKLAADQQRAHDLKVIAFDLAPQDGQIPELGLPAGTDYVALNLELEKNEFPAYRVTVKNPTTGRVLWRTGQLKAIENSKTVRVRLRASLFNQQNYVLEASGISASGANEDLSSYPFRVVMH